MQSAITAGELLGVGLVIVDPCETLYKNAVGNQTIATPNLLASETKLTSGTVMMTLVDDGLIALDDRIDKYLPYFTDAKGAVTIRQLLAQTHGLLEYHSCIPQPGQQSSITLAQCVEQIAAELPLPNPAPGTVCNYNSGVSYHIMGRIAEIVTGKSWETLWRERVATPLQMNNSTYVELENPRVGGGLQSTLDDYSHLLQMHLRKGEWNGARILSEWAVAEMQKDSCIGIPFLSSFAKPELSYGLTWWIDEKDGSGIPTQLSAPSLEHMAPFRG
ncbi:beta-lactamase family protein [bacterium]|nr:beta-lactamase family protein [bacterium]